MTMDGGLSSEALASDASKALESKQSDVVRGGPSRAGLMVLGTVQLAWVACLVYGAYRAIEVVGGAV